MDEDHAPLDFVGHIDIAHGIGQTYGKRDIEEVQVGGCRRSGKSKALAHPLGKRAAMASRPLGTAPRVATPWEPRSMAQLTTMAPITESSAPGIFLKFCENPG